MGVLTASILLSLMILPTIISVSKTALQTVPQSYYQVSIALGASHETTVFAVMALATKRGLLAGVFTNTDHDGNCQRN